MLMQLMYIYESNIKCKTTPYSLEGQLSLLMPLPTNGCSKKAIHSHLARHDPDTAVL